MAANCQVARNAIIDCIEAINDVGSGSASIEQLTEWLQKRPQTVEMALSDNLNLGFIHYDEETDRYHLTESGKRFAESTESDRRNLFSQQCRTIDVFHRFIEEVDKAGEAGISHRTAAVLVLQEMQLGLADTTIDKLGSLLANWAEYAGIIWRSGRLCTMKRYVPEQMKLFS